MPTSSKELGIQRRKLCKLCPDYDNPAVIHFQADDISGCGILYLGLVCHVHVCLCERKMDGSPEST